MDLKQLEYITAIGQCQNITEAASKLFLTPSALNQQLLKLERELNVTLFTRTHRQMIPTKAGQIYLEAAQQMLDLRQVTYSKLQDLSGQPAGIYRIGLTFEHGSDLFARIYPDFHSRYPGIQMRCVQLLVPDMIELLASHQLDIAFVLTGDPSRFQGVEYQQLSAENLVLGIPIRHPLAKGGVRRDQMHAPIDMCLLKNDDFSLALARSTMRTDLINPIFQKAGYAPNVITESSFNNFLEQLAALGVCCTIIPQSRIHNYTDISWFYLPGFPRFQFGVAYAKGYRLNQALQEFINIARTDAAAHLNFATPEEELGHRAI